MVPVAVLESRQGRRVAVEYYSGEIKTLAADAKIDAYIVSTEDGFSPLGSNRRFLASELGVPEDEIRRLADWNRFKNPRVTLAVLPSRRENSCLRGLIVAPSQTSECYQLFAAGIFARPYRDFFTTLPTNPSPTRRRNGVHTALRFLIFPGAVAFTRT